MQANIIIHFKPGVRQEVIAETQAKWGLKPVQIRKDPAGTSGATLTYEHDPLSPLSSELPVVAPLLVEKVTARIPFYEDAEPGVYPPDHGTNLCIVRRTAENGVLLNIFECVASDVRSVALIYGDILTGKAKPIIKYGVRSAEAR